jgi:hypothetical protein
MQTRFHARWMIAAAIVIGTSAPTFAQELSADIFIVVAKRKDVANDPENRAAHLVNSEPVSITYNGATANVSENGGDGDGFIDMSTQNPGKSPGGPVPTGHLIINELVLENNNYTGTGVLAFDSDGDGKVTPDDDGDDMTDDDLNDDNFDDEDQVVPLTVRLGIRSNSHGDFAQGNIHAAFDDPQLNGGSVPAGEDTAPTAGDQLNQPRLNGRIRSDRNPNGGGGGASAASASSNGKGKK